MIDCEMELIALMDGQWCWFVMWNGKLIGSSKKTFLIIFINAELTHFNDFDLNFRFFRDNMKLDIIVVNLRIMGKNLTSCLLMLINEKHGSLFWFVTMKVSQLL